MSKKLFVVAPAAAIAGLLSLNAQANLVVNGNFGTVVTSNNAPPWGFTPATEGSDFYYGNGAASGAGALAGYVGNYANFGGVVYPYEDEISQNLATVAGDTYTVSFYLSNDADGSTANDFSVSFGGTTLFALVGAGSFGWNEYTFTDVPATAASTALSFYGDNVPSWYSLADVVVTGTSSAVPEPGTLAIALFGLGLLGAGVGFRRSRD
jgi:hypothetical protein